MEASRTRSPSPEGANRGGGGGGKTLKDSPYYAPASPRPKTSNKSERDRRYPSAAHSAPPDSRARSARGAVQVENCHWTKGQIQISPPGETRGFDNSDRNKSRNPIGSCTDRVADERRIFGPWHKPDSARQEKLVQRLSPHKPLPPLDPKFDGWVNHFEHYWNIGIDIKETRRLKRSGGSANSQGRSSYYGGGDGEDGNGIYRSQYHRLLKRPRTGPAKFSGSFEGSDGEHNMSTSSSSGDGVAEPTRRLYAGTGRERRVLGRGTKSAPTHQYRDTELDSARSSKGPVVSGLDRRYMGLQSVPPDEMRHIVSRLTRLTSAYQAKFAPNPHVWVDTEPGAHMVKREHTVA